MKINLERQYNEIKLLLFVRCSTKWRLKLLICCIMYTIKLNEFDTANAIQFAIQLRYHQYYTHADVIQWIIE